MFVEISSEMGEVSVLMERARNGAKQLTTKQTKRRITVFREILAF